MDYSLLKLTKLERFVADNPDMHFDVMAGQLNRSVSTMVRAYERLEKKVAAYKDANLVWSDFCKSMGCEDRN